MLLEVREKLRTGLGEYVLDNKISVYRGRKDKIKIGDTSFNTVNQIIKNPSYKVHNNTIIKLLDFLKVPYDIDFFKQNDIIKLYETKEDNSEAVPSDAQA